ncbi:MAG: MerR family transcriptional regulator [Anaerolineae bacterium]|nr:MerR family transcriptional regulator [Anaerolineae bacterium]
MAYTVKQLADLAGISVRTLHYYDEIDLLPPSTVEGSGYRYYDAGAVLRLQQILFYKELGLSLKEIKGLLDAPDFDVLTALEMHKKRIEQKAGRIRGLLQTVENTIQHLKGTQPMSDSDLFKGFDEAQQEEWEKEVVERWGADNPATIQSKQRWGSMSDAQKAEILSEGQAITLGLAELIDRDPDDPDVQALVARQHKWIGNFYDCSLEMLEGLGLMYTTDPRFAENYSRHHPDLPQFFYEAIKVYVKANG